MLLCEHGTAYGHDDGDDAIDALGAFVLGGLEVAGGVLGSGVANPALVLGDEPTDGLALVVVEQLCSLLRRVAAAGTTILLAVQNVHFASGLARRGYVIDKGLIRGEGPLTELLQAEAVVTRYPTV